MNLYFTRFLAFVLILVTTSCATLFTSRRKTMDVNSNVTPLNVIVNQSDTVVCTGKVKVKHKDLNVLEFSKEGYHSDYKYFYPDKIRSIVVLEAFIVFPLFVDMIAGNVMKISTDNMYVNMIPRIRLSDSVDMNIGNIEFVQVYSNGLGEYRISSANSELASDQLYPLFSKVSKTERLVKDAIISECQYSGINVSAAHPSLSLDVKIQDMSATSLYLRSNMLGNYLEKIVLKTNVFFTINVFGERLIGKSIDENTLSYQKVNNRVGDGDDRILVFYDLMEKNFKKSVTKFLSDAEVKNALNDYISNQNSLFQFDTDGFISFTDYKDIITTVSLNEDMKSVGFFINSAGYFVFVKPKDDVQSVKLTLPNGISLGAEIVENISGKPYGIGRIKTKSEMFAVISKQNIFETDHFVVLGQRDGRLMFKEDQSLQVKSVNDQTILESDIIEFETGDLICAQDGKVMGFVCINDISKKIEYYHISSLLSN
jgi:hypothetical protein